LKSRTLLGVTLAAGLAAPTLSGQQPAATPTPPLSGAQFDVVSIKPHPYDPASGGGMRTLPDGTFMMTSQPIWSIITYASPVPVSPRNVTGLPEWARTEGYDIIAKPAPDSHPTREQLTEMMRNLLIERLKVVGHVEEQQQTTFALVVARSDGRLGSQLKKSTVDCAPPSPPDAAPQTRSSTPSRCGMRMGQGTIEATGMALDRMVRSFGGLAGGEVTNRTGLDGLYDLTLRFSPSRLSAGDPTDDAPQFETALQEQLGLKLVAEKTMVKIFVVDHIERPTPD